MSNQEPNIEGWLPVERMPKRAYNVYPVAEQFIPRISQEEKQRRIEVGRKLEKERKAKELEASTELLYNELLRVAKDYMTIFDSGEWNAKDAESLGRVPESTYAKTLICLRYPKSVALQMLSEAHLGVS